MLDEPSLGLAPIVVLDIMRLVKRMRDEDGVTVLLVEQNVKQSLKPQIGPMSWKMAMWRPRAGQRELLASEEVRKAYLGI